MSDQENNDESYNDPELAINRVYTRRGDAGSTELVGGQSVRKSSERIAAYGTVDELNAELGAARQTILDDYDGDPAFQDLDDTLLRIQHELFNLGSILATLPEDVGDKMPRVTETDVDALEESIETYNEKLPELRSFVLPGGSRLNVQLHRARTLCRRAERAVVRMIDAGEEVESQALSYLNRLGDALFVWARWAAVQPEQSSEVQWDPNVGSSGSGT